MTIKYEHFICQNVNTPTFAGVKITMDIKKIHGMEQITV